MRRRLARRLLIGAVVLLLLWLVVSWAGARLLAHRLGVATGLAVTLDHLGVVCCPLGLAANGVTMRSAPNAPPSVRARRIVVTPHLGGLLRSPMHLARARLIAPAVRLWRAPDGRVTLAGVATAAPPTAEPSGTPAALIDRLDVLTGRALVLERRSGRLRRLKVHVPRFGLDGLTLLSDGTVARTRFAGAIGVAGGSGEIAGRYRGVGRRPDLKLTTRFAGVELVAIAPYVPDVRLEGGRLAGQLDYERGAGATPADRLRGAVEVAALAVSTSDGSRLALRRGQALDADVDIRAGTVRAGRVSAAGAVVSLAERAGGAGLSGGSAWSIDVGATTIVDARIERSGTPGLPLRVEKVFGRDLSTRARSGLLQANAELDSGGKLRARGALDPATPAFAGRVKADAVTLAPLLEPYAGTVRVKDGWLTAAVDVVTRPFAASRGTITVDRFGSIAPREGGEDPVLAWDRLTARIDRAVLSPLDVRMRRVALSWPYLVVRRDPDGFYPLYLVPAAFGAGAAPDAADAGAGSVVAVDGVAMANGGIFFEDRVVNPPYIGSLSGIRTTLRALGAPPFRLGEGRLDARINEVAPLTVRARVDDAGVHAESTVERLPLPPLNAYLAQVIGYVIHRGGVAITTEIDLKPGDLRVASDIVVSRLDLDPVGNEDLIQNLVGVPFTLAVALMKDYQGRLHLSLPLQGDPTAPTFSVRNLILPALRDVILGAISSPLRLVGSVFVRDGTVEALHVDPIAFEPGQTEPSAAGTRQVDSLAVLLEQRPSLAVALHGQAGPEDEEALRDQEIVRRLRAGAQSTVDRAVLAHLEARADPNPAPPPALDERQSARLAALRAEITLPPGRVEVLADERAAQTRKRLVEVRHVDGARVQLGAVAPAGPPAVLVDLAPS